MYMYSLPNEGFVPSIRHNRVVRIVKHSARSKDVLSGYSRNRIESICLLQQCVLAKDVMLSYLCLKNHFHKHRTSLPFCGR